MKSSWWVLLAALGLTNAGCHDSTAPVSPPMPRVAAFVQVASLQGVLVYGEPWSPDGARLAYYDATRHSIAVFDALRPQVGPLQVVAEGASEIRWSPDGGWLLLIRSDGRPTFARHLIAARIPRPNLPALVIEVTAPNPDISHAVWASNGNIYWWNIVTGERKELEPPPAWRSENPSPFMERTHLLPGFDATTGLVFPFVFETEPDISEQRIVVRGDTMVGHVVALDVVPGRQQFLLDIYQAPCSFTALVNRFGTVLTRFWAGCASGPPGGPFTYEGGASVSADRRFVIGYREVEDGHNILSSELILTDLQATWVLEVANTFMGLEAHFAATGLFVGYERLYGIVEVGVLNLDY